MDPKLPKKTLIDVKQSLESHERPGDLDLEIKNIFNAFEETASGAFSSSEEDHTSHVNSNKHIDSVTDGDLSYYKSLGASQALKDAASTSSFMSSVDTERNLDSQDESMYSSNLTRSSHTTGSLDSGIASVEDSRFSSGRNKPSDQAKYGCSLCTPKASCAIHKTAAVDYKEPSQIPGLHAARMNGNKHVGDNYKDAIMSQMTTKEFERFQAQKETSKSHVDLQDGPFCCTEAKFGVRESSGGLTDQKHAPIHDFVKALNTGNVTFAPGSLDEVQRLAIKAVVKINPRVNFEEESTWLACEAPGGERVGAVSAAEEGGEGKSKQAEKWDELEKVGGEKKWVVFGCLEGVEKFQLNGPAAYLFFRCSTHKREYRIGYHSVRWTKSGTYATFGSDAIDRVVGVPTKPKHNYGY